MSVAALRPDAKPASVEVLLARIEDLARERQDLRGRPASRPALERNRLALVRSQWQLSYALIERHLRGHAA
jgi:DNA-binding response OmpR family regulator